MTSGAAMIGRRRHALIAGFSLLGAAAVVAVFVVQGGDRWGLQRVDDGWLHWMTSVRTGWITRVAGWLSVIGGPLVMVPVRLGVVAWLALRRRWLHLGAFVATIVSSELCIGPLKAAIDRPRPPGPMTSVGSASFPSGHAIAAASTAVGLVVVLVPSSARRSHWIGLAAGFVAVMAASRTYLHAHWASDVVAGVCLGVGLAIIWPTAFELARERWRAGRFTLVATVLGSSGCTSHIGSRADASATCLGSTESGDTIRSTYAGTAHDCFEVVG